MAEKHSKLKGHFAMSIAEIMWGMNAPMVKLVLATGITPLFLNDCRMIGAAVLFWIASLFVKQERVCRKDFKHIFIASLLGLVLNQGMFLFGVRLTSPFNASIISTISPILTMVLAAIFLHEPITKKKVGGVVIGALGAILLVANSAHIGNNSGNILGDILCILAQSCYSCYLVFYKNLTTKYSPITLMKWMFTFSTIIALPSTFTDIDSINYSVFNGETFWGILFIVLGATFTSYLLLPIGQKSLRPTVISSYNYIQPIVSGILAIMWGFDSLNIYKLIAIALVFTGVFMVIKSKSREQMENEVAK